MTKTALIADIGGTNARFGIVDNNGMHDLTYLQCRDYAGPAEAAEAYLKQAGASRPSIGVFTIAGPVDDDLVSFTNLGWSFRKTKLREDLALEKLEVMNDFHAVALAVPSISPDLLQQVWAGQPAERRAIGVIGPGTGLGGASLIWSGDSYAIQQGEVGHETMPFTTEREFSIYQQLRVKYHHVSSERVCSGKGLENLYNAIRALDKKFNKPDLTAPEISEKAISGGCEICTEALDLMLGFLGRIMGNHALSINAKSGMYIAGGIPGKLGDYFLKSRFHEEFVAKGRFRDYMMKIPVYLIKHDAIGLLGLESHAKSELKTV